MNRMLHHPEFLQKLLRPVSLEDRKIFLEYFQKYPPQISNLLFANIFCLAEIYHLKFCEYKNHLLISFRDETPLLKFLPPVGPDPAEILTERLPEIEEYSWKYVDEGIIKNLPQNVKNVFERDTSDYAYKIEDLCNLRGKKFDGKRNFIKRFLEYHPEVKLLTSEMIPEARLLEEEWFEHRKKSVSLLVEHNSLLRAFDFFSSLFLSGIAVFVEKKMVGFACGEALNTRTFVEQFEKSDDEYVGISPFLLHEFARFLPKNFTYLNREDDLGIPGLRKAKESWYPEFLVKKYAVES
ncbi:DUF2156 domain-containing protein [Candidatus Peregrinibacteria bacterium]|nr:DUF2156 domain-containing protein [Candidatus Peregrinibacteria bacterium]